MNDNSLTVRRAAMLASLSTQRIYAIIKSGRVRAKRDAARGWQVDAADFQRWMAARRQGRPRRDEA